MRLSITSATRRDILECGKSAAPPHAVILYRVYRNHPAANRAGRCLNCVHKGAERQWQRVGEKTRITRFSSHLWPLGQLLPFTKEEEKKRAGVSRQPGYVAHPFRIHNCVHVKVHRLSDCFHISCVHISARRWGCRCARSRGWQTVYRRCQSRFTKQLIPCSSFTLR